MKTHTTRVELDSRVPCFHCSKSLQYIVKIHKYVGFRIDGEGDRFFHLSCVEAYLEDQVFLGPWYRDLPKGTI